MQNEIIGIVGRKGSGKSTALRGIVSLKSRVRGIVVRTLQMTFRHQLSTKLQPKLTTYRSGRLSQRA